MSGSTTPNYGFTLPTIGGDMDVWGNELNGNWTALDSLLPTLVPSAPTVDLTGYARLNSSPAFTGSVAAGGSIVVNYPTTNDFNLNASGGGRNIQFADHVNNTWSTSNNSWAWWYHGTAAMVCDSGGNFQVAGTAYKPGGGSWLNSSDDRVKRNVTPYRCGLAEVCALSPIAYEYNGQGGTAADGKTYYGLSAQATQPVMPELVHEMEVGFAAEERLEGQLGMDLGPLTLALVNAVRELAGRVAELEAERA